MRAKLYSSKNPATIAQLAVIANSDPLAKIVDQHNTAVQITILANPCVVHDNSLWVRHI